MFRFEELEIWRLAIAYGKECYRIAGTFPKHENYGLGDQLRRAGVSPSSNIAEGSVGSNANFKKFINIAIGSVLETASILNFALELGYIDSAIKVRMYEEAEKLIRKCRSFSNSLHD